MRRRPSPSLVVSIIALVFAAAGTSIAAVNFARNAGAVDHKSAVGATSSTKRAAGKLVATNASGQIPTRFLDKFGLIRGGSTTFHQTIDVNDNGSAAPVQIAGPPYGTLNVTCQDQNATAGKENAKVSFAFANTSGQALDIARTIGNGAPVISLQPSGALDTFAFDNENTFRY